MNTQDTKKLFDVLIRLLEEKEDVFVSCGDPIEMLVPINYGPRAEWKEGDDEF